MNRAAGNNILGSYRSKSDNDQRDRLDDLIQEIFKIAETHGADYQIVRLRALLIEHGCQSKKCAG